MVDTLEARPEQANLHTTSSDLRQILLELTALREQVQQLQPEPYVRHDATRKVHKVKLERVQLHPMLWAAHCGLAYALMPHDTP